MEKNKCSHLCLKSGNSSIKCDCPTGMELINETNCNRSEREFEIYLADSGRKTIEHVIRFINQEGFKIKPLTFPSKISSHGIPSSLDVHLKSKFIYWADKETKKVQNTDHSNLQNLLEKLVWNLKLQNKIPCNH